MIQRMPLKGIGTPDAGIKGKKETHEIHIRSQFDSYGIISRKMAVKIGYCKQTCRCPSSVNTSAFSR